MNTEQVMNAINTPPAVAPDMLELSRETVEALLANLEASATTPQPSLIGELRLAVSTPKVELWAVFVAGPGELWPALNREHAEHIAQTVRARVDELFKAERLECALTISVIPSPYGAAEHFEVLADQMVDEARNYHLAALAATAARDKLRAQIERMEPA